MTSRSDNFIKVFSQWKTWASWKRSLICVVGDQLVLIVGLDQFKATDLQDVHLLISWAVPLIWQTCDFNIFITAEFVKIHLFRFK